MKKNITAGRSLIGSMLLSIAGLRPVAPAEMKLLSDFLRDENAPAK